MLDMEHPGILAATAALAFLGAIVVYLSHKKSAAMPKSRGKEEESKPSVGVRYGEASLQGRRPTMEDCHICVENVWEEEGREEGMKCSYFGVFDGHGGQKAAEFAANTLHQHIVRHEDFPHDAPTAIQSAFLDVERNFLEWAKRDQLEDGTTAVIAILLGNELHVANVGDSEAVLCHNGTSVELTTVHNPAKNPNESERVEQAGGKIYHSRVGHPCLNHAYFNLAISRAIGDLMYKVTEYTKGKSSGVTADPDIRRWEVTDDDEFLILACDGVWDVYTHQQAVDLVREELATSGSPEAAARKLVTEAEENGSVDNITAIVVQFVHQ